MATIVFADNFLAGSILTLVLPVAVLSVIACWYVIVVRRIPGSDTSEATATPGSVDPLPPVPPEVPGTGA